MTTKKDWSEFRNTGLLFLINSLLHVFGWAIVFEMVEDKVIAVYPARVTYRGFEEKIASENYLKLATYMAENSKDLLKEIKSQEEVIE